MGFFSCLKSRQATVFVERIILVLSILLLQLGTLKAQTEKVKNRPYADYKLFHWGFHVGVHVQDLVVDNKGTLPREAPEGASLLYASVPSYTPGFSVGVIADYSPILNLNFRLMPTLHFGETRILFSDASGNSQQRINARRNSIEIPLLVKYSAVRFNNTRPYITAGPYASFTIGQSRTAPIAFNLLEGGMAFGLGCDIYLRYFKLSPELRLMYGLTDILKHNRPEFAEDHRRIYTELINRMQSRMILLTFNFE